MRLVFMGTSSFAVPCLDYLSKREDMTLAAVVTKPSRPAGRGRELRPTPVKEMAEKKGLRLLEREDVKSEDFRRDLKELDPDLIVVAAFGKILPGEVLRIPRYGAVNIHASLLPRYRGASPINWAIINGEKETGVTSFFMEEGLDTGPIISQRSCAIGPEDDSGVLEDKLKGLAVEVLAETLEKVKDGQVRARPQDETKATLAPKITPDTGKIDWAYGGEKICNLIRGLSPRPGAYAFFKKDKFINQPEDGAILVKIWKAAYVRETVSGNEVGKVIEMGKRGLKVSAGEGLVLIEELQPAGKRRMKAQEFWPGYSHG